MGKELVSKLIMTGCLRTLVFCFKTYSIIIGVIRLYISCETLFIHNILSMLPT